MMQEAKQQAAAKKMQVVPEYVKAKAIDALAGYASGYISGWEAAKAEEEAKPA